MTKEAVVKEFDVSTAKAAQVKAESMKVITAYNNNAKAFIAHFIGLCDRFVGVDSQSGLVLANFLNCLDKNPRIRNGVIEKLNNFADGNLNIIQDGDKWKVQTAKGKGGKSVFDATKWTQRIAAYEESGATSLLAGKGEKKAPSEVTEADKIAKIFGKLEKDIKAAAEVDRVNLITALEQTLAALRSQSATPPALPSA